MVIIKWRRTPLDIVQLQFSWDAIDIAVGVKTHVGREEDSNRESRTELNALVCYSTPSIVDLTSEICPSGLCTSRLMCTWCRTSIPQTSLSCTHMLNLFGKCRTSCKIHSSWQFTSNFRCSTVRKRLKLVPRGDPGILNSWDSIRAQLIVVILRPFSKVARRI